MLKHAIKTDYTVGCAEETDGALAEGTAFLPMRKSDCSLEGKQEEITSDVVLPNSRLPSESDPGPMSSEGDLTTEFNADEQDDLIAAAFMSEWKDETPAEPSIGDAIGWTVHGEHKKGALVLLLDKGTGAFNAGTALGVGSHTYVVCAVDKTTGGASVLLSQPLADDIADGAAVEERALPNGITAKSLHLGEKRRSFSFVRKYYEVPVEWQRFNGVQVNTVKIEHALKAHVKLTFGLKGTDWNDKEGEAGEVPMKDALTTKAFTTLEGDIRIGDTLTTLAHNRQTTSLEITVNNNLDAAQALYETMAVESSPGDLEVSGSIDVYNSDNMELYNEAKAGARKWITVRNSRTEDGVKTTYITTIFAKLKAASESKDGNRYKYSVPFQMYDADSIVMVKVVEGVGGKPLTGDTVTIGTKADGSPFTLLVNHEAERAGATCKDITQTELLIMASFYTFCNNQKCPAACYKKGSAAVSLCNSATCTALTEARADTLNQGLNLIWTQAGGHTEPLDASVFDGVACFVPEIAYRYGLLRKAGGEYFPVFDIKKVNTTEGKNVLHIFENQAAELWYDDLKKNTEQE